MLGSLGGALEVVEEPSSIRLREKDGALMFLHVCCHCEWVVAELVVSGLRRSNAERLWSGPVFSVDDRLQEPMGVGLVMDGQMACLFGTYGGREMKHL